MTAFDHIVYGLLWLSFGTIHSLLAGNSMKDRLHPLFGRGYRLAYNLFASLHILLVVVGSRYVFAQNVSGFEWPPMMHLFLTMAMSLGIVIMLIALCQYDLGRFSGLTQLTASPGVGGDDEVEPLHLSGLHRYVRHPLLPLRSGAVSTWQSERILRNSDTWRDMVRTMRYSANVFPHSYLGDDAFNNHAIELGSVRHDASTDLSHPPQSEALKPDPTNGCGSSTPS